MIIPKTNRTSRTPRLQQACPTKAGEHRVGDRKAPTSAPAFPHLPVSSASPPHSCGAAALAGVGNPPRRRLCPAHPGNSGSPGLYPRLTSHAMQSLHGFVHSQGSLPALEDLQMDAPAQSLASEPDSLPHNSTSALHRTLHSMRAWPQQDASQSFPDQRAPRVHPNPSLAPTLRPASAKANQPSGSTEAAPSSLQSPPLLSISTAIILGQWLRKGHVPTGPSRSGSAGGVSGYHS